MKFSQFIKLIHESPRPISKVHVPQVMGQEVEWADIYPNLPHIIIDNKRITIKESKTFSGSIFKSYSLVHQGKLVGEYSGKVLQDGIQTLMTAAIPLLENKSLMAHFYTEYLLKEFRFIQSDSELSAKGFQFWYRNFDFFIKEGFVVNAYRVEYGEGAKQTIRLVKSIKNANQLKTYYSNLSASVVFRVERLGD